MKKAKTHEQFSKVDHDYVLNFAESAKNLKVSTFVVVSARGADPQSILFYNQVKGQMEEDLKKVGFDKLIIMRPSLLIGERAEERPLEYLAQQAYLKFHKLFPNFNWSAQPVLAEQVAKAMLNSATKPRANGVYIINNDEMLR